MVSGLTTYIVSDLAVLLIYNIKIFIIFLPKEQSVSINAEKKCFYLLQAYNTLPTIYYNY